MLTASRLPDWQTVSSLSLSWCMRRALIRNSVAEKRYPNTMEPRRKILAAASHAGVPSSQPPDCNQHHLFRSHSRTAVRSGHVHGRNSVWQDQCWGMQKDGATCFSPPFAKTAQELKTDT